MSHERNEPETSILYRAICRQLKAAMHVQSDYSEMERSLEASILAVEVLNKARQTLDALPADLRS